MAAKNDGGNDSNEFKSLKILVLGNAGIGKTTLMETYFYTLYTLPEKSGIFKEYSGRIKCGENIKAATFFDLNPGTNWQERMEGYPKDVNAILLCFSIEKYDTLLYVNNDWIKEVRLYFGENIPILLVGLKSDTRILIAPHSGDNLVKKSEVEAIHKKHCLHGEYMECSKNDRDSVVYVLEKAVLAATGE